MKKIILFLFLMIIPKVWSQNSTLFFSGKKEPLKVGDKAPDFIVTTDANAIRSFIMPYMKDIVVMSFWSSDNFLSRYYNKELIELEKKYKRAHYINASELEVIAVAVQTDMGAWRKAMAEDSMQHFDNCIAAKLFDEEVCKKFNVEKLPHLLLIDENGIILAINPTLSEIEKILDGKKNMHPVTSDISGVIAHSSNSYFKLKNAEVVLVSHFGDSISSAKTDEKGKFVFDDIKLNQDFILRLRLQPGLVKNDRLALFSLQHENIADAKSTDNGFEFSVPARVSGKLAMVDSSKYKKHTVQEIDVIKFLEFNKEGKSLTDHDKSQLQTIINSMQKNPDLVMEFYAHTDSKLGAIKSSEITGNQVETLKKYFSSLGIPSSRIIGFAKGQSELRKICHGDSDCSEEDHKLNRRVEFWIYKDVTK